MKTEITKIDLFKGKQRSVRKNRTVETRTIIGIDANEANLTTQRVGINQYAFELVKALYQLKTKHQFVIYLKTKPLADLPKARLGWQYRVIPFPKLWTQTRLPWDLFTHSPRPDVFLSLTHYAPRIAPMPTVVAIMDLGFLQTPEQFTTKDFNQLKNWTKYSVNQAKKVIAISQHTKQDIVREYGKKLDDVIVTPLAYDKKLFKPTRIVSKAEPYILFLGSLKPSKNIEGLVRAFAKLSLADLPVGTQLVIVGKKAWLYTRIFELVKSLKLEGKVDFRGFVEEAEKPVLMSQAAAFVMPSFYEGFGIPALEAMACGTPVVVSNVASLPEVAGDAGIYVDPKSVDSIATGIKMALGPKRQEFVNRGLKRVKLFSWVKTAMQTLKVIESALLVAFFWLLVTSYSTAFALTTSPYRSASIVTTDGSPSYTNLGNCSATDGTTCDRPPSSSFANLYFRSFGDFGIATGSALTAIRTRVTGKANTSPYLGV